jgi:hypothetical protein
MQLRAARDTAALGDLGGGGPRVAELGEAFECCIEQTRSGRRASLFLCPAPSYCRHAIIDFLCHAKETVNPDCLLMTLNILKLFT